MADDDNEDGGQGTVVDFSELEAATVTKQPLDPATLKLEGDAIPEAYRGKSVADIIALQEESTRALAASRDAINDLRNTTEALRLASERPAVQQPAAPAAPAELTREQLRELYEKDPFEYQQHVLSNMERRLESKVESRVAPLATSTASASEAQARAKFAEEFSVLGDEINAVIRNVQPAQLAAPGAWDQVIYYVRGQHIDKLVNARNAKRQTDDLAVARQREVENGGVQNGGNGRRTEGRKKLGELTAQQKEIAEKLGVSQDEYRQFYA